ncbi:hypothetical protein AQUCO_04900042v1 [Aquilegia coerulea]|uniref:F-box associated beta-propeller type 1 domain-containing protein n=1 Tax=Aquilegia coerulea TaxID=218851 RepID=A0A2G5CJK3_AQUCA|nr:hypothetical protein AQUCO_04900042v1 [Aquilegia coerulea]
MWNPFTTDYKELPEPLTKKDHPQLGFCYNPTSKDYEVVRIVSFGDHIRHSEVEIYSLKENSWRRIQNIPYSIESCSGGELLNGTLHWIDTRCTSQFVHGLNAEYIIAFDINSREFRTMPLPDYGQYELCCIALTLIDGFLSLFCNYETNSEIWMMMDYGAKESWTKAYTIPNFDHPLTVTKKGELIYRHNSTNLRWYVLKDRASRQLKSNSIKEDNVFQAITCIGNFRSIGLACSEVEWKTHELSRKGNNNSIDG